MNANGFAVNRTSLCNWNGVDGERGWRVSSSGTINEDVKFYYTTDGTLATEVGLGLVNLNTSTEYNICIEREGSNLYFYVDGVLIDTQTISATIHAASTANTSLSVGAMGDETSRSNGMTGYLKGVRVTKGVARYGGSNYTVPSIPLPKE